MDIFTKADLRNLVELQTAGCVSLSMYIPTYKPGRAEIQQNPARLKNMLREAEERLVKTGIRGTEVDSYLKPARRLLEDSYFWTRMSDGLVIFLSKDYFSYYRLPIEFPELLVIANTFHIKPLLPILASDGRFFVLAISQKSARVLECTRFGYKELDIAGKIPQSVEEALQFHGIDRERESQYHLQYSRGSTAGSTKLAAHGPETVDTKDDLVRFFSLVDRGLQREILHNETAPLIVVTVDYLFPIYQKENTYEFLLGKAIEGNPDKSSLFELHEQSVSVALPYFQKKAEEAKRIYGKYTEPQHSAVSLDEIVTDAYDGRVRILFIADNGQKWGKYDPMTRKVEIHSKAEPCDIDLLDFAAAHTLAHRGDVYTLKAGKVPDGGIAAAVLRY